MAKKSKPETKTKGAQKVTKDKRTRKESGPRKSVVVLHEGKPMTLGEVCALKGLKMSTVYNRVRSLFKSDSNALVINSDNDIFSTDKPSTSAKCYAIFANGFACHCRVSEALKRDYQVLITKRGCIIDGKLNEYSTLESYDAACAEPAVEDSDAPLQAAAE